MYKLVIFTGIAILFAWPVFAALVLKLDDETVGSSATGLVTVFLLGVDAFWWWVLFGRGDDPADKAPAPEAKGGFSLFEFKFWQSLALVGTLGGFWLFGPLSGNYPEYMPIWIAMALGPIVLLVVRFGFSARGGE